MYMSEKNVGKEKCWKLVCYLFVQSWLPTINVGDHVGDIKGGKKRFGGNENNRYYKV